MNIKASKWVGGGVVGGFIGWVVLGCMVGWVVGGFIGWVCGGVGGGGVHYGVGDWRAHGVGAYTHPPMNSYNVKTFHFMNTHPSNISKVSLYCCTYTHPHMNGYDVVIFHFMNTHPPIKNIQSVTIRILWMVHGVGGRW